MNWKKLQVSILDAGMATGGGAAGRVLTKKVWTMIPWVKEHKTLHPALTFLVGAALMDRPELHYVGVGMAAVAGTDLAADFVPFIRYEGGDIHGIEADMEMKMADELERRLNADVNSHQAALNADVNDPGAAMNDVGGIENSMDERLEGVDGIEDIDGMDGMDGMDDDLILSHSQAAR